MRKRRGEIIMFQKNKKNFFIMIILGSMLMGCGNGENTSGFTVSEPSQMPDIVFMDIIDYTETAQEGDNQFAITFYDKNGNHYTSNDAYVCGLKYEELVTEYAAGNLKDKITFHTTCDVDELFENYQKLCEVSENKEFEIIYPEAIPTVQANRISWYGIYYDKDGEMQIQKIQESGAGGRYEANDEQANEIYNWYIGTFQ